MATYSQTLNEIKDGITMLFRELTGKANPTYIQRVWIGNAVNEALQQMCLERGIERWNFLTSSISKDTTSGTSYIDLDAGVFSVVTGSVRIPAENHILQQATLEYIHTVDPEGDTTGLPHFYAYDASANVNTPRLELWPVPDATYTVTLEAESIVDEDEVGGFPNWFTGALIDLATSIAMRRCGFGNSAEYKAYYEESLKNLKDVELGDGPLAVQRTYSLYRTDDIHRRAN